MRRFKVFILVIVIVITVSGCVGNDDDGLTLNRLNPLDPFNQFDPQSPWSPLNPMHPMMEKWFNPRNIGDDTNDSNSIEPTEDQGSLIDAIENPIPSVDPIGDIFKK